MTDRFDEAANAAMCITYQATQESVARALRQADREAEIRALTWAWHNSDAAIISERLDVLTADKSPPLDMSTGSDTPWPLRDVLAKLAHAADILLREKDYDALGWESIQHASEAARRMLTGQHTAEKSAPSSSPPSAAPTAARFDEAAKAAIRPTPEETRIAVARALYEADLTAEIRALEWAWEHPNSNAIGERADKIRALACMLPPKVAPARAGSFERDVLKLFVGLGHEERPLEGEAVTVLFRVPPDESEAILAKQRASVETDVQCPDCRASNMRHVGSAATTHGRARVLSCHACLTSWIETSTGLAQLTID